MHVLKSLHEICRTQPFHVMAVQVVRKNRLLHGEIGQLYPLQ